MRATQELRYEGFDGVLTVRRPAPGIVVVTVSGRDRGEHGGAPLRAIEKEIAEAGSVELFLDARTDRRATVSVGREWAGWLAENRDRLRHVSVLVGARFLELGEEFLGEFGRLGAVVRVYCDPVAFDAALDSSTANQRLELMRAAS